MGCRRISLQWSSIQKLSRYRRRYLELYKAKLTAKKEDPTVTLELSQMDGELDFQAALLFRCMVHKQMKAGKAGTRTWGSWRRAPDQEEGTHFDLSEAEREELEKVFEINLAGTPGTPGTPSSDAKSTHALQSTVELAVDEVALQLVRQEGAEQVLGAALCGVTSMVSLYPVTTHVVFGLQAANLDTPEGRLLQSGYNSEGRTVRVDYTSSPQ
eukprot:gene17999-21437_t